LGVIRVKRTKPTIKGTLIRRHSRFLVDVELVGGKKITAMCANTGSMRSCNEPGRPIILSDSENDERKYRFTWELIHMGKSWVNVNTGLPNTTVEAFVGADAVPELKGYPFTRREVKYGKDGKSRIDLLLTNEVPPKKRKKDPDPVPRCNPNKRADCYVEIKNTSMRADDYSVFPDAVTTRGQKHLRELTDLAEQGIGAAMFYFCGRTDTKAFRPADEIDPEYGKLLRKAAKAGVLILPYQIKCTETAVELVKILPVEL
jgi:sugar fermentation stimulation protein A